MQRQVYKVSQINAYVKRLLAQAPVLSNLSIVGEISNFKRHTSGHLYFVLKDEMASVNAVMFSSDAQGLRFVPADGQRVIVEGSVSLYEKTGQYQLYIRRMRPDGEGGLYLAFEALKKRLEAEGLFDESRKKRLPMYAHRIILVTSPTGAAVQDMMRIARRRCPGIELLLVPVLVQGEGAAASIARGLALADRQKADIVIVGRGGGSIEDLWAFNEEVTARAIAAMNTPVISAVGHETDFTIADFAADVRASTPSAAAELAVVETSQILEQLEQKKSRMRSCLSQRVLMLRHQLEQIRRGVLFRETSELVRDRRLQLDHEWDRLTEGCRRVLSDRANELERAGIRLELLNPQHTLARGFSYVMKENGHLAGSIADVRVGDRLQVVFKDGSLRVSAEEIMADPDEGGRLYDGNDL